MHTFKGVNGTKIHYNSDFSEDVIIVDAEGEEFVVDGEDLKNFLIESIAEDTEEDIDNNDTFSPGNWEICYNCPDRNTIRCKPQNCNPLDI